MTDFAKEILGLWLRDWFVQFCIVISVGVAFDKACDYVLTTPLQECAHFCAPDGIYEFSMGEHGPSCQCESHTLAPQPTEH